MQINQNTKALIFDLDGTLADTMPTHYIAWKSTLSAYGIDFPENLFYSWAGRSSKKIVEMLNEMHGTNMIPEKVDHDKEQAFLSYIHTMKPIENVLNIAKKYHGILPMAIGTGGIPEVVNLTLKTIGADHLFDIIVTAHDVQNHKPAPDTFLLGAKRMGVEPQFCQVFEDANLGVEAAKSAGMMVTDIRDYL